MGHLFAALRRAKGNRHFQYRKQHREKGNNQCKANASLAPQPADNSKQRGRVGKEPEFFKPDAPRQGFGVGGEEAPDQPLGLILTREGEGDNHDVGVKRANRLDPEQFELELPADRLGERDDTVRASAAQRSSPACGSQTLGFADELVALLPAQDDPRPTPAIGRAFEGALVKRTRSGSRRRSSVSHKYRMGHRLPECESRAFSYCLWS